MLLVLMVLGLYAWRQRPREIKGIEARGGTAFEAHLGGIPLYRQRDERWGQHKIGGSGEMLESVGCTVASLSMGLAHFGID
ncbi:MAG: hypothetical protein ACAI44_39140, partial [Candidatus Sericytochromatia bacterium]